MEIEYWKIGLYNKIGPSDFKCKLQFINAFCFEFLNQGLDKLVQVSRKRRGLETLTRAKLIQSVHSDGFK